MGRQDEARELFERLLGTCNDVGLLSEEYDVSAKRLVGNFPQAFSHVPLIDTARSLSSDEGPKYTEQVGPAAGVHRPITVASWLELTIPQLWRPAGDVVLDCAEHLDVDLRTSTPRALSQRPAEHRFEAHDAPRGDVAGEGSVRPRG